MSDTVEAYRAGERAEREAIAKGLEKVFTGDSAIDKTIQALVGVIRARSASKTPPAPDSGPGKGV